MVNVTEHEDDVKRKKERKKEYSLPELNDWRSCIGVCNVGGVFPVEVNTVLCEYKMMCYFWCIAH